MKRARGLLPDAHTALIIEDHADVAEMLIDWVRSMGHGYIHCETLEEVLVAVEAGDFCYALVDAQFPPELGARPSVGAIEAAMAALRKLDGRRNENDKHLLPIAVATGYSEKHKFVSRMYAIGADMFVAKPFDEGLDVLLAPMLDLLKGAGHEKHEACVSSWAGRTRAGAGASAAAVAKEATARAGAAAGANAGEVATAAAGAGAPAAEVATVGAGAEAAAGARRGKVSARGAAQRTVGAAEKADAAEVRLVVDGRTVKARTVVTVNGKDCELQPARFNCLLRLMVAHCRKPGTPVDAKTAGLLNNPELTTRIRESLAPGLPPDFEIIEASGMKTFKLNPVVIVEVDWEALERHHDPAVVKIAQEERGRLERR